LLCKQNFTIDLYKLFAFLPKSSYIDKVRSIQSFKWFGCSPNIIIFQLFEIIVAVRTFDHDCTRSDIDFSLSVLGNGEQRKDDIYKGDVILLVDILVFPQCVLYEFDGYGLVFAAEIYKISQLIIEAHLFLISNQPQKFKIIGFYILPIREEEKAPEIYILHYKTNSKFYQYLQNHRFNKSLMY